MTQLSFHPCSALISSMSLGKSLNFPPTCPYPFPLSSGPAAGPAIPTSNSYSKKTQSNNAENKRPEEDREPGRKASSTAKVPASPLPGLERKKTTPTPSTVSHAHPLPPPGQPHLSSPSSRLLLWGLPSPGSSFLNADPAPFGCLPDLPPPGPLQLAVENPAPQGKSKIRSFPARLLGLLAVEGGGGAGFVNLPVEHFGFL